MSISLITKKIVKSLSLVVTGGMIYYICELVFRGKSHWTMFLVGGICFFFIGLINEIMPWNLSIIWQAIIGGGIITGIEFAAGVLINMVFKLNVWDYSNVPFNIFGQICLPFSLLWILLSIIAIFIDDFIRWSLFNEEKPHYKLF